MPINHVNIEVPKDRYEELRDFYLAALGPLGYKLHMEPAPGVAALGKDQPDWWITAVESSAVGTVHVAFGTTDRGEVRKFHEAAVAAGAKDNGAPGMRAHYHPAYYAAFVKDPVGNNLEVVCHIPDSK